MLQPASAEAFVQPMPGSKASGLVFFSDTALGMRVTASIAGLDPGRYRLEIDEYFYGSKEGLTCAEARQIKKMSNAPIGWMMGPVETGADGVGRFDHTYEGIGVLAGRGYYVPSEPVVRPKARRTLIALRGMIVTGRKLLLFKQTDGGSGGPNSALACAIVQLAQLGGRAEFVPRPTEPIEGTASFGQKDDNRTDLDVKLSKLAPGKYRLVVHELSDCDNVTSTGAGEPYHPEDSAIVTEPHYRWPLKKGELGVFTADAKGTITARKVFNHPLTSGSPHSISGRAIVVTTVPDTAKGESPTRVGCARIMPF